MLEWWRQLGGSLLLRHALSELPGQFNGALFAAAGLEGICGGTRLVLSRCHCLRVLALFDKDAVIAVGLLLLLLLLPQNLHILIHLLVQVLL